MKILPHDGLDFDLLIGTFQGGQVHFAVPLQAVRISRPDQAAFLKHREIERRARLQFVHVHVRPVLPRSQGAGAALGVVDWRPGLLFWLVGIRADSDGPGERFQAEDYPRLKLGGHRFRVELEILHVAFGKFGGQQTDGGELLAGKIEIEAGVLHNDFLYADFHRVARLCAVHVDWSGHRMRPAAGIRKAKLNDVLHRSPRLDLVHRVA